MHHFIFPTQDAWISSGSSTVDGESFKDQNFGKDQIIELKKEFFNDAFHHQTRALLNFNGIDFTELKTLVNNGTIPTNAKYYLRLYEAEGNAEISSNYTLNAYSLYQDWSEGTGKFGDNPKTTNGVSWENRSNIPNMTAVTWSAPSDGAGNSYASGTLNIRGDVGIYSNQEVTIGGVDFVFVSGSTSVFDNTSTEIFVESGSTVEISAGNLSASINNSSSLHGLPITATSGSLTTAQRYKLFLSGSEKGTAANLSAASSSTAFSFTTPGKALEGGTGDQFVLFNNYLVAFDDASDSFDEQNFSTFVDGTSKDGGIWVKNSQFSASQTFNLQSPDISMDITNLVNNWVDNVPNYGLLLKFSGSQETDSSTFGQLKFFSRDTHTIYSPRIEACWDDHTPATGDNTGSLNELTMSGLVDNYLYIKGLRESYKENERVKFRVGARKRYIQKTFTTSAQTVTGSYIPEGKGSYAIKDVATDEFVVPFSSYTTMSCDTTGPYFNQWLDGFYPDRVYKILLKLNYNDGQEQIFDNDFEFVIRRS